MVSGGRTLKASSASSHMHLFWPEMKPVRHSVVEDAAQTLVNRASVYFFLKLTQNHSIKFLGPEEWSEGKIT